MGLVFKRLSSRATSDGACMLLTRTLDTKGRAQVRVEKRMRTAARVVWEELFGQIPPGRCVCHTCDKPNCIQPAHLFLGTQAENMRDKAAKGRCNAASGQRHYRAKLSDAQVQCLREQHAKGTSYRRLALAYGMSLDGVRFIVKGLRRK